MYKIMIQARRKSGKYKNKIRYTLPAIYNECIKTGIPTVIIVPYEESELIKLMDESLKDAEFFEGPEGNVLLRYGLYVRRAPEIKHIIRINGNSLCVTAEAILKIKKFYEENDHAYVTNMSGHPEYSTPSGMSIEILNEFLLYLMLREKNKISLEEKENISIWLHKNHADIGVCETPLSLNPAAKLDVDTIEDLDLVLKVKELIDLGILIGEPSHKIQAKQKI